MGIVRGPQLPMQREEVCRAEVMREIFQGSAPVEQVRGESEAPGARNGLRWLLEREANEGLGARGGFAVERMRNINHSIDASIFRRGKSNHGVCGLLEKQ